ncbi:hypothetical protein Tco_1153356 [Tanacetum coccineum]
MYRVHFCWNKSNVGVRQKDKDILEGLQTHAYMKSLTIINYSTDCFPKWVMNISINVGEKWISLNKLVNVTLSGCHNVLYLPILWKLPLLRIYVIKKAHTTWYENPGKVDSCSNELLNHDITYAREVFLSLGLGLYICCRLVPSCYVIFDLEPLSSSFDFVFSSGIFESFPCLSLSSLPSCDLVS